MKKIGAFILISVMILAAFSGCSNTATVSVASATYQPLINNYGEQLPQYLDKQYYYRVYKKIRTINKKNADPKRTKDYGTQNLYEIYSAKGTKISNRRFLNYIQRCEHVFGKEEELARILYTHYGKIKHRLRHKNAKKERSYVFNHS